MKLPGPAHGKSAVRAVGLAATACNSVAAIAVERLFGLAPLLASLVGYPARSGSPTSATACLTFRRPVMHGPQFVRFAAISLAGFAINQTIVVRHGAPALAAVDGPDPGGADRAAGDAS